MVHASRVWSPRRNPAKRADVGDGSAGLAASSLATSRMRVAHIHTFNDADIIDGTIAALRAQTRPVDGIVVDNASTDGTLAQPSVRHATVLRHPENRGTSGTVYTGMRFALDQGYDWIWVLMPIAHRTGCACETADAVLLVPRTACRRKPLFSPAYITTCRIGWSSTPASSPNAA